MSYGIIVYTGENFNYEEKGMFLLRCLKSIERQRQQAQTVVLCSGNDVLTQQAMQAHRVKTHLFENPADGLNECIKDLEASHFVIARYDSIFAPESVSTFSRSDIGCSMVFNVSARTAKGSTEFAPIYAVTDKASQLETSLNVWNMTFDRQTVMNNKILFKDFKYADQYLYIARYMSLCDKLEYENSVQMCLDRSMVITLKMKTPFYRKRNAEILETARLIRKKEDTALLMNFVREMELPMINLSILSKKKREVKYLRKLDKRLMKVILG